MLAILVAGVANAQVSGLGKSPASVKEQYKGRVVMENLSPTKFKFTLKDGVAVFESNNNRIVKETIFTEYADIKKWASVCVGLEKRGWTKVSITKEGGDPVARFNKGNTKAFVVFTSRKNTVGIVFTFGNY